MDDVLCSEGRTDWERTGMNVPNARRMGVGERLFVRLLNLVAWVLATSGGLIVFVVLPYDLLGRWHLLPHWDVFALIYLMFPILLAWNHAGGYIVAVVLGCESILVVLQSGNRRAKVEGAAAVGLCVLAYLCTNIGKW